jgi:succinate dehydrogenase / fumarate reductase cytochrome b subunit
MAAALTLYRTTIGKKAVMAITGFIGYGFVILHMIGNLKIFEGAEGF